MDEQEYRQEARRLECDLVKHLSKYYTKKHGDAVEVEIGTNLLGETRFRTVTFADGYRATFCKRDESVGGWFRNERHVPRRGR